MRLFHSQASAHMQNTFSVKKHNGRHDRGKIINKIKGQPTKIFATKLFQQYGSLVNYLHHVSLGFLCKRLLKQSREVPGSLLFCKTHKQVWSCTRRYHREVVNGASLSEPKKCVTFRWPSYGSGSSSRQRILVAPLSPARPGVQKS